MSQQKVCILGLGYIGLPTACLFAKSGFQVLGVDVNPTVVKSLQSGKAHLVNEPDLDVVLAAAVQSGKLHVDNKPAPADFFIICVPTPFKADYAADLTYVEAAMQSILPHVRKGSTIALESTSPPGTTRQVVAKALEEKGFVVGKDVFVGYCPERVLPGQILKELTGNPRIVGGITAACASRISAFYKEVVDAPVHETAVDVAEMVKLVENSFRDVNIAFANEISMMCGHLGVDHKEVIRFANGHPRVKILSPGPGVGGHCIAVDPWFLVKAAPEQTPLIRTAREVNLKKTEFVVERIKESISDRFKETNTFQKVYLYGMTYKPNVADFRESPALEIYHLLSKELGNMAEIIAVDPYFDDSTRKGISTLPLHQASTDGKNIFSVRLVAHNEFNALKFSADFSQ